MPTDPVATSPRPLGTRERRRIRVSGIVQGVGFRPFVFGLAGRYGLSGEVGNDSDGVFIEVEGAPHAVTSFADELQSSPPPLARVDAVTCTPVPVTGSSGFTIVASVEGGTSRRALVSPDTTVCDDCLSEMLDPVDRRHRYPFINCTNCGPRFTITVDVPYDRHNTTMAAFTMCDLCDEEYHDPSSRRFHAQPNACTTCGPTIRLLVWTAEAAGIAWDGTDPLTGAQQVLDRGLVLAVKGVGGFHLACDARDPAAVELLRLRKRRDGKPLAVMVPDVETARAVCEVDDEELALLTSVERPIVLLRRRPACPVTDAVAPGNDTLGVMLPYTPLHHLLLGTGLPPGSAPRLLVMTSGNLSDTPIVYRDEDAIPALASVADAALVHDRDIHMRCDDSVVRVAASGVQMLRRSRGYAPASLRLAEAAPRPALAVGAHMKSTFCFVRDEEAFLSQHIGDLETRATTRSFAHAVEHLSRLFSIEPEVVAHDLHPGYESTRFALSTGLPTVAVQHHEAHIASVMAEHRLTAPVIGIAADGTGYGHDGTIWGGEFLVGDLSHFERFAHLATMPLPGGEMAVRQPWRLGAAYLSATFGEDFLQRDLDFVRRLDLDAWHVVDRMIQRGLNTPQTSSMGRLFDAVAAILGLRDEVRYEGQAAVELEFTAARGKPATYGGSPSAGRWAYPFHVDEALAYDVRPALRGIVQDLERGLGPAPVAFRFHATVVALMLDGCERARRATGIETVVLGGGVFQNRLLLEMLLPELARRRFDARTARLVPPNDGGISLGQAAIAIARSA